MKVEQEPDALDARAVRWTAGGLLLGILLCSAAATLLLRVTAGEVAPRGFVAGRQTQHLRELAAIELGLFATHTGRGARGTEHAGASPISQGSAAPALLPLEAALEAYLAGVRPRRPLREATFDPGRVEPGAVP